MPAWFFQDAQGLPLAADAAGREVLRARLRAHIYGVAESLSGSHGLFGDGNPVISFDVVNEVVSDSGEHADGLRRSEWYRILGEEYIDLAFRYADEAFNDVYASPDAERPVTLMINDYSTEWPAKAARLHALVERLLARGVPVDGVGHQFHVSLGLPVERLSEALDTFEDLPVSQAVTELDVPTGLPVTADALERQADYYEAAVLAFEARPEPLTALTIWGLTDDRSWRNANEGSPVLFDAAGAAKPAALAIAALVPPPPAVVFTDIAANPFRAEIEWLAATGVTTGWETTPGFAEFRPLQNVNRDQMAAFLYRFAGAPDFIAPEMPTFSDVPADHVFFTEIEWLAAQDITHGWTVGSRTEFRPTTAVNRDVMAVFLYRFGGSDEYTPPEMSPFVDVPTDHVFSKEISWLAESGVTYGWDTPAGTQFRPTAVVKRDVMAAFLSRYGGLTA